MSWNCLENKSAGPRGVHVVKDKYKATKTKVKEETLELDESLMLKRILIKGEKKPKPTQQRNLFRIVCDSKRKCYKMIIDGGNMDNFVSMEMVEKLRLQKMTHPTPY